MHVRITRPRINHLQRRQHGSRVPWPLRRAQPRPPVRTQVCTSLPCLSRGVRVVSCSVTRDVCPSCPHASHPTLRPNPDDSTLGVAIVLRSRSARSALRVEPRSSTAVCACVYDVTVCCDRICVRVLGKVLFLRCLRDFQSCSCKRPCMHTRDGRTGAQTKGYKPTASA